MKVGIINFSGNVGKTTLATYCLKRNMACPVFSVETINTTDNNAVKIDANDFAELQTQMLLEDDLIIDIGSSNVEAIIKQIILYRGSQDDFDFFIIPVTPEKKQVRDTIETILFLTDRLDIPVSKIKVVFNKVKDSEISSEIFTPLNNIIKELSITSVATIYDTTYFTDLSNLIQSGTLPSELKDKVIDMDYMVSNNETFKMKMKDFVLKSRSTDNEEEKIYYKEEAELYSTLTIISRLGIRVLENFDLAYENLFNQ